MAKKDGKRPFTVIANWKMNKTIQQAQEYAKSLPNLLEGINVGIWIAVPFTAIRPVREMFPSDVHLGAQNMNDATEGAFTGEVAGKMVAEAGADFVILGHSERRQYFHESDEFINHKVFRALETPLTPILCVGESLEEREGKKTGEKLREQLQKGLEGLSEEAIGSCVIAYEPVWAIGTGKSATPEIILDTHGMIRGEIASMYNENVAQNIRIVYGGSVSTKSAESIAKIEGVDGFLIGTASLDPESFAKIAQLSQNR